LITDQTLEILAKHSHFCYLDGYSGFSQIAVHPEDQLKIIFTCPFGLYAYRRMPFRLCNAHPTFQTCMTTIFSGYIEHIMEVFMDDFSIYGTSFNVCLRRSAWPCRRQDHPRVHRQDSSPAIPPSRLHLPPTEVLSIPHLASAPRDARDVDALGERRWGESRGMGGGRLRESKDQ
jgi:hypothetical protein